MPDNKDPEQIKLVRLVTEGPAASSWLSAITEWLKIIGATVAVVLGSWAAVTGLQAVTTEKRAVSAEKEAVVAEKKAAEIERDNLAREVKQLQTKQEELIDLYRKTKGQAENALEQIADLKTQATDAVAKQKLADVQGTLNALTEQVDAGVAAIAPPKPDLAPAIEKKRVFLHINKPEQREAAEKIQQAIKDFGCIAPGIQNIGGRGYVPDQTEIRYFRYPEDKEIAKAMLDHLAKTVMLQNARISYVDKDPSATRTGQIEIWFSGTFQ